MTRPARQMWLGMLLIRRDGRSTGRAGRGVLIHALDRRLRVDQRLMRIRVVGKDVQLERRLPRIRAKSARCVDVGEAQQPLHDEVCHPVAVLVGRPHGQAIEQTASDEDFDRCDPDNVAPHFRDHLADVLTLVIGRDGDAEFHVLERLPARRVSAFAIPSVSTPNRTELSLGSVSGISRIWRQRLEISLGGEP